jgi:succinate-acetate transporter protein
MADVQRVGVQERGGAPEINLVADPAPLGLGAFAATTFLLSLFNADLLKVEVVLPLAFLYGGIAQVLAGMWEFRNNRNTFGATAFTSYGAFWLTFYWLVVNTKLEGSASDVRIGIGAYLLAWTIFTFYMWVASLRLNGALIAVFTFLLATFAILALGEFVDSSGLHKLGGWLGIITAILAWYTAAAITVNSTFKKVVLPTWPVGT